MGNSTSKPKQNSLRNTVALPSLNDIEIAGSLINQGFPFSVLAKCLQFF